MDLQSDFRELLESFNAHEVEFLVVGGFALAFHGAPRFTGDLDLFVRPDAANATTASSSSACRRCVSTFSLRFLA